MLRSRISGIGMYVPEEVVRNEDLASLMDTSDEWIVQRTGIRERRFAPAGVCTSEIAVPAAQAALADAGISSADVDLVLFATLSPDFHFPGTGCTFQARMGMPGVPVMDIRNQCTGFLYALATADAFVRIGTYRTVLVVGAEIHSHAMDFSTTGRDVAVLFGDGAGAAVVTPTLDTGGPRVRSVHLHADGRHADALRLRVWDISRKPYLQHEGQVGVVPPEERWPEMNGREVFRHAVEGMTAALHEMLEANALTAADIDLFVPHQANMRISELVARRVGIPPDKVVHSIVDYGNTTAASIPMGLCLAREQGRLRPGMRVALAAFGSGFTWGSALVVW
ncbi:MAG: ketoacyl-ACP synthase III [Deltaproteobacteria bacterium]|nr:ketoacyl-ACP synthase III [Deltaproteobacteria bacterium]